MRPCSSQTGQRPLGTPRAGAFQRHEGGLPNVPAQNSHGKAVAERFKAAGMKSSKDAGFPVGGTERAVGDMLKEHVVYVAFCSFGNNCAKRAAGLFCGFL